MDSVLRSRVASVLGSQVSEARISEGGYSGSRRWVLSLDNGSRVFIKVGTTDHTRHRLRDEARFYQSFQSEFTPELLGFEDDPESPILLLEDLSDATWPPPWTTGQIERVLTTLEHVASSSPPDYLPSLEQYREGLSGWERVEEDPSSFLSLGLTTKDWLDAALPVLKHASGQAVLSGSSLIHFDVRSDNVAFTPGRTVLVDWSIPAIGNPLADVVGWLPSLHVEGGPPPHEILGNEGSALVALITGYWASQAGLPPPQGAPHVREVQRAQLEVSLPWAARLLDLPPP
jgi:hypothetical protein